MFQTFRNAWKIPELKNRLLFTLAILVVYRLGLCHPRSVRFRLCSDADVCKRRYALVSQYDERRRTGPMHALRVRCDTLYQRLHYCAAADCCHSFRLENLAKEADGQQKLQQINRYAGAVVALIMSIGYYFVIRNMGALKYVSGAVRRLYRRGHHRHLRCRCSADHLVRASRSMTRASATVFPF